MASLQTMPALRFSDKDFEEFTTPEKKKRAQRWADLVDDSDDDLFSDNNWKTMLATDSEDQAEADVPRSRSNSSAVSSNCSPRSGLRAGSDASTAPTPNSRAQHMRDKSLSPKQLWPEFSQKNSRMREGHLLDSNIHNRSVSASSQFSVLDETEDVSRTSRAVCLEDGLRNAFSRQGLPRNFNGTNFPQEISPGVQPNFQPISFPFIGAKTADLGTGFLAAPLVAPVQSAPQLPAMAIVPCLMVPGLQPILTDPWGRFVTVPETARGRMQQSGPEVPNMRSNAVSVTPPVSASVKQQVANNIHKEKSQKQSTPKNEKNGRRSDPPATTLMVRNLAREAKSSDLARWLLDQGWNVDFVHKPRPSGSVAIGKTFAFVNFLSAVDANNFRVQVSRGTKIMGAKADATLAELQGFDLNCLQWIRANCDKAGNIKKRGIRDPALWPWVNDQDRLHALQGNRQSTVA